MKRTVSFLIILFCFMFLFTSSCGGGSPTPTPTATKTKKPTKTPTLPPGVTIPINPTKTPAPISLLDSLGREVHLPKPATKVVSLAPSITETLFAIGAGSKIIGRDDQSDFPGEALKIPTVGGELNKLNLETLTTMQPELVLLTPINGPEQLQAIEQLGFTAFYLANPKNLDEMYGNILLIAQLVGNDAEAATLVVSLRQRVDVIAYLASRVEHNTKVLYEIDGSNPSKVWTAGPGSHIQDLITLAGGENVGENLLSDWGQISLEELNMQNPDVILLGDTAYGFTPLEVSGRAGWENITAIKEKRIYEVDDNIFSRPGPRLVEGLEVLAKILHPEMF